MKRFAVKTDMASLEAMLSFLCYWFGPNAKLADINEEEFIRAFNICMRPVSQW